MRDKAAGLRAVVSFALPVVWRVQWRDRVASPWLPGLLVTLTCFAFIRSIECECAYADLLGDLGLGDAGGCRGDGRGSSPVEPGWSGHRGAGRPCASDDLDQVVDATVASRGTSLVPAVTLKVPSPPAQELRNPDGPRLSEDDTSAWPSRSLFS